jgi:hypothetical protein
MMMRKNSLASVAAMTLLVVVFIAAAPVAWKIAGDPSTVKIAPDGTVTLTADKPVTAGAVSPTRSINSDAVLVEARVGNVAEAGAVVFSLHNDDGDTVAYWRSPLPILPPTEIAAILESSDRIPNAQLFVGTHDRPSRAKIENVRMKPVRRTTISHGAVWGVIVDDGHIAGQTYRAAAGKIDAVQCRIRQLNPSDSGPDFRVRLFPWPMDSSSPPIVETIVPRQQTPRADGTGERELVVPLHGATARGKTYFIQFGTAGACSADQAYLMFAGTDRYPQGSRFENGNAVADWDVWLDVYQSE